MFVAECVHKYSVPMNSERIFHVFSLWIETLHIKYSIGKCNPMYRYFCLALVTGLPFYIHDAGIMYMW